MNTSSKFDTRLKAFGKVVVKGMDYANKNPKKVMAVVMTLTATEMALRETYRAKTIADRKAHPKRHALVNVLALASIAWQTHVLTTAYDIQLDDNTSE